MQITITVIMEENALILQLGAKVLNKPIYQYYELTKYNFCFKLYYLCSFTQRISYSKRRRFTMSNNNTQNSIESLRSTLNFQFDISWQMLEFHLTGLEDEECLWRHSPKGLTVTNKLGIWEADWPDNEEYDMGPSSIAWLNLELMKNASEIGCGRFLYASRKK